MNPAIEVNVPKIDPAHPDWVILRAEFLYENLAVGRKNEFKLKDLAARHGVNYGTLRNVAGREGWSADLNRMRDEKKVQVDQVIMNVQLSSEIDVRVRQAQFAVIAQQKAMLKLQAMKPEALTPSEAIKLLELGMNQERKALGLDDSFAPPPQTHLKSKQTLDAIASARATIGRLKQKLLGIDDNDPIVPSGV